jgi:hypothetical protein
MKRTYEIPRALDIAISTLSGQKVKPLGICFNGSHPSVATCGNGETVGQDTSWCSPNGLSPEYGKCTTGTIVAYGCGFGSIIT